MGLNPGLPTGSETDCSLLPPPDTPDPTTPPPRRRRRLDPGRESPDPFLLSPHHISSVRGTGSDQGAGSLDPAGVAAPRGEGFLLPVKSGGGDEGGGRQKGREIAIHNATLLPPRHRRRPSW
ncbi:hypothetical protein ACP70R_033921 [Stipagrostis hirtigluma subsp. patula]